MCISRPKAFNSDAYRLSVPGVYVVGSRQDNEKGENMREQRVTKAHQLRKINHSCFVWYNHKFPRSFSASSQFNPGHRLLHSTRASTTNYQ